MRVLPTKLLGRLAVAGAAGALAVGMTALPASADPPADVSGETLTLDCGNAGTYEVVTAPGEGQWTPAFDTASNKVFIPVAFGPASGSVTVVATGEVIDSFSDDSTVTDMAGPAVKGQGEAPVFAGVRGGGRLPFDAWPGPGERVVGDAAVRLICAGWLPQDGVRLERCPRV